MRKVCLFYSQNNNIVLLTNKADTFFWRNSRGVQRLVGFFLDCAFRRLIGWAGDHMVPFLHLGKPPGGMQEGSRYSQSNLLSNGANSVNRFLSGA